MGAGASAATIHPPHIADKNFKELLASEAKRNHLFNQIAGSADDGHLNLKDKISLKKLVDWFADNRHPLYTDFKFNILVLKTAFKDSARKKAGKHVEQLTQRDMDIFLSTLFLYTQLFEMFDMADKTVIEDSKVFKSEFLRVKPLLGKMIEGIVIEEIPDDVWVAQFDELDRDKDGFISFNEFCKYVVKKMVKPHQFVGEYEEYEDDVAEDIVVDPITQSGEQPAPASTIDAPIQVASDGPSSPRLSKPSGEAVVESLDGVSASKTEPSSSAAASETVAPAAASQSTL